MMSPEDTNFDEPVEPIDGTSLRPKPRRHLYSLIEAQSYPDGVVYLFGDEGGEIYLVAPASRIRVDETRLQALLRDLDRIAWPGQPESAGIGFLRQSMGSRVTGGWVTVTPDVWVGERFVELGMEAEIRDVVDGRLPALVSRYCVLWMVLKIEAVDDGGVPEVKAIKLCRSYDEAERESKRLTVAAQGGERFEAVSVHVPEDLLAKSP